MASNNASFSVVFRDQFLIETEQLHDELMKKEPKLKILNATWYMPNDPRDAKKEHLDSRITKATQYFDIDKIALPGSHLPHTMPDLKTFTEAMRSL